MADKRKIPAKVARMQARKKQKLGAGSTSAQPAKPSAAIGDAISIDALPWRDIPLPDHLDDYEGFYGMEEIDDVEVVRTDEGKVSFRVAGARAIPASQPSKPVQRQNGKAAAISENDDEFDGFSDDDRQPKVGNQTDSDLIDGAFSALQDLDEDEDVSLPEWDSLGLSPETLASLARQKFSKPTLIQQTSIPHIIEGHDLVGKAQTGSGKTLAFGIPILEYWLRERRKSNVKNSHPTALIILPTRELAHQIEKHLTAMCSHDAFAGLTIATVTGGLSVQKQQRLLAKADIVIATPGRIWEVVSSSKGVLEPLQQIRFLVLDEADRLLSQGHFKELEELLTALDRDPVSDDDKQPVRHKKKPRQTLIFSATFSKSLQQKLSKQSRFKYDILTPEASMEYLLQKLNFRSETPKFVDVNPTVQLANNLKEGLLECATGTEKDLYLYALMLYYPRTRALVFVNSIAAVRRLVPFLQYLNIPALALHSQMPQKARLRTIERFSGTSNKTKDQDQNYVLVATDVAARGLDIPHVRVVVHYHLPRTADTYVHRSGRTARAENAGTSVLICAPEEAAGMRRLLAQVHAKSSGTSRKAAAAAMQSLDLDKRLLGRIKPRAALAKQIADAELAKEKKRSETGLLAEAAEDLGVELDSDFEAEEGGLAGAKRGRGKERREREREGRAMSKAELRAVKAELKELLAQRVNTGVSERYLTSGGIDIDALLKERERGVSAFLGELPRLGFDGL